MTLTAQEKKEILRECHYAWFQGDAEPESHRNMLGPCGGPWEMLTEDERHAAKGHSQMMRGVINLREEDRPILEGYLRDVIKDLSEHA